MSASARGMAGAVGLDLRRFASVAELLRPKVAAASLAACHAAVVRPTGPLFKIYLSPFGRGPDAWRAVLQAALDRLGHGTFGQRLLGVLGASDDVGLLSLDLVEGPSARVKLYLRPRPSTAAVIEDACRLDSPERADDARRFFRALSGSAEADVVWPRPIYVCHHLVDVAADRPARIAIQAPMWPGLGGDDEVRGRMEALFAEFGLPSDRFAAVHAAMSGVTDAGGGLVAWVSLQREDGAPRITVYFAAKAYAEAWGWHGIDPEPPWWPSPVRAPSEPSCAALKDALGGGVGGRT